jgi:hypothetical protein
MNEGSALISPTI